MLLVVLLSILQACQAPFVLESSYVIFNLLLLCWHTRAFVHVIFIQYATLTLYCHSFLFTFTFWDLADAFVKSDFIDQHL